VRVLNLIASEPTGNHIYTPNGGWANLRQSHLGAEPGSIELRFITPKLVKPCALIFVNFGDDILWNYFRIITGEQPLSSIQTEEYYSPNRFSAIINQIMPARYAASEDRDSIYGSYITPETTKELNRNSGGNDFVIASPASPINHILLKDETLHRRLGHKGFRDFIQKLINRSREQN
jgi:hypothetical protein